MYHTMGLNSDHDTGFDDKRKDHFDLYNIRYLIAYDQDLIPPFARIIGKKPGIILKSSLTRKRAEKPA